jgi:hypothetical protein
MNTQTQDRLKLKCALLDLGKPDYEKVRADLIERLGYDQFREIQNDIFKEIGTLSFDEKHAPRDYRSQLWREFGDITGTQVAQS